MSMWYYYDMSGNRSGPIDSQKLRELAAQGVVVPDTQIETDAGKKGLAKQISGLFSNSGSQDIYKIKNDAGQYKRETTLGNYPQGNTDLNGSNVYPFNRNNCVYCTHCGVSMMPDESICASCGAVPVGHHKFCRFCGTSINPEQTICFQCKFPIGQRPSYNNSFPAYPPYANTVPTIMETDTDDEDEETVSSWKKTFDYLSIPVIIIVFSIVLFSFLRDSKSPDTADGNGNGSVSSKETPAPKTSPDKAAPLVEARWENNAD